LNKRRSRPETLAFAALLALAAAACGSNSAAPDAATGGDAGDATAEAAPFACDPAAQNCASGSECDFACEGGAAVVACRADNGSGALGAACSASMPCVKGTACIGSADAGVICRKYCAGDGDCLAGQRCHNDSVGINCGTPITMLLLHTCY
jgi:hypothetical protein